VNKRVTSIDVAKAAGVSQATVSYVFNGRKGAIVPTLTRDNVLKVAKDLGYRPHRGAQSMKTGKTNVIAFWNVDIQSSFATQVLRWIRQSVEEDGYELMVTGSLANKAVARWPVDGVLAFDSSSALLEILGDSVPGVPIVSLGAFHIRSVDFVGVDLYSGAVEAVRHLIEKAPARKVKRRVAYLLDRKFQFVNDQRYDAYTSEVGKSGITLEYIDAEGFDRCAGYERIKEYIVSHGHPDSLLCLNDEMAIGAQRAFLEAGLKVPDDVAIIGCDGIADGAYHSPSISTIVQPLQEVCAKGWQYLRKRLTDPTVEPQQTTIASTLLLRESTR